MRSRCPLWIGSNIPGYTARLPTTIPRRRCEKARKTSLSLRRRPKKSQGGLPEPLVFHGARHAWRLGRRRLVACWSTTTADGRQQRAARDRRERVGRARGRVRRIEKDDGEAFASARPASATARAASSRITRARSSRPRPRDVVAQRAERDASRSPRRPPPARRARAPRCPTPPAPANRSRNGPSVEIGHERVEARDAHPVARRTRRRSPVVVTRRRPLNSPASTRISRRSPDPACPRHRASSAARSGAMLRLEELRVAGDQRERLLPRLLEHGAVADEIGDPELGKPRLPRAEELPGPPHREVHLGDLEPVVGFRHGGDAAPGVSRRRSAEQDAVALERPAPHAAAKLVELGETEALGVLDQHHGRVGHVDARPRSRWSRRGCGRGPP